MLRRHWKSMGFHFWGIIPKKRQTIPVFVKYDNLLRFMDDDLKAIYGGYSW